MRNSELFIVQKISEAMEVNETEGELNQLNVGNWISSTIEWNAGPETGINLDAAELNTFSMFHTNSYINLSSRFGMCMRFAISMLEMFQK